MSQGRGDIFRPMDNNTGRGVKGKHGTRYSTIS
jgi:hypothetical protein